MASSSGTNPTHGRLDPGQWLAAVRAGAGHGLVAVAAVVIGAWAVAGDSAAEEPAVALTASRGAIAQSNSRDGAAILSAGGMKPGDSATGRVTIENTGQEPGSFYLGRSDLRDEPGPRGGALSGRLEVAIDESIEGAPSHPLHRGQLGSMGRIPLGRFAPGESRTYTFTVDFPDTRASAAGGLGDNAFQGSAATVAYKWTATGDGTGSSSGGGSGGRGSSHHRGGSSSGRSGHERGAPGAPVQAPGAAPRLVVMRRAGFDGWVEQPGLWLRMGVAETLRGGVPLRAVCAGGCRMDATLSLERRARSGLRRHVAAARHLRRTPRPVVVAHVSRSLVAAGALDAVVTPTARGRQRVMRRLHRAHKTRVTLAGVVVNEAGTRTRIRRTIILRLPRHR